MFPKMNTAHLIGMSIVALSLLVTSSYSAAGKMPFTNCTFRI